MRRSAACSSVGLLLLLVSSVGSAQTRVDRSFHVPADVRAPLPPNARAIVDSIPDEGLPQPTTRHYFLSNERRHDLYGPLIEGRGGVLVGVGSDQNYTMAAIARSQLVFVVDYDPRIPWIHEIYRILVSASETPDALIARFTDESVEETEELLRVGLAGHPDAPQIAHHFERCRDQWLHYLRRIQRIETDGRRWSWLGRPELYDYVRALHRAGRIIARNGDLTGERTVRAIGHAARRLELLVRVVYFSNAEQYFPLGNSFRENMRALPTDQRTVALRTMRHVHLPDAENDTWHYIVHDWSDYIERLESGAYRRYFAFAPDIVAGRAVGEAGLSHMTRTLPRTLLEQLRHRRQEQRSRRSDPL